MRVLAPPHAHGIVVELDVIAEFDSLGSDDEVVEVGQLQSDLEDLLEHLRIAHELVLDGRVASPRKALVKGQEHEPSPQRVRLVGELGQIIQALHHDATRPPLHGALVLAVNGDDLVTVV